jgi:hypothetical protein
MLPHVIIFRKITQLSSLFVIGELIQGNRYFSLFVRDPDNTEMVSTFIGSFLGYSLGLLENGTDFSLLAATMSLHLILNMILEPSFHQVLFDDREICITAQYRVKCIHLLHQ